MFWCLCIIILAKSQVLSILNVYYNVSKFYEDFLSIKVHCEMSCSHLLLERSTVVVYRQYLFLQMYLNFIRTMVLMLAIISEVFRGKDFAFSSGIDFAIALKILEKEIPLLHFQIWSSGA